MAHLKLPEFDSRNIIHVVKENFVKFGHKTQGIRMIYAGEHGTTKEAVKENFYKSVKYVNQGYTDIPVKGILLVYDSYFVHILEGSEETLHRQIRFLFNIEQHWKEKMTRLDEEAVREKALAREAAIAEGLPVEDEPEEPEPLPIRIMLKRMKMLMVYHSITTFIFDSWIVLTARPPSLVGKLDLYAPIAEHIEQLKICLDKITFLCKLLKEEGDKLSFEGLSANDPKIEALPEVALLDYLLNSPHIMDLREVASYHRRVDDHIFYFEQVWPLPTAYTPRNLYKLKIDDSFVTPLPIMPWEIKEDDGEERDDDRSSDSY